MKKLLLLFAISLAGILNAQATITSTADGDFYSLSTWDCFCIPTNGDTVIIEHDVNMNLGILYNSGRIEIMPTGSLSDGGVDKDIAVNGGEFINHGTLDCDGFLLDSGYFLNDGIIILDSLWTRDDMDHEGTLTTFDFLNDQGATFTGTGDITVGNNFANQGVFILDGVNMTVANDASNCNIASSDATMEINTSVLCIENDFLNCGSDTLRGNGEIFIGSLSTNGGEVEGTLDINTSTGGFTVNTGTIEGTVTFGTSNCYLGQEESTLTIEVYPNPSNGIIYVTESNVEYALIDISGKTIEFGFTTGNELDFSKYTTGVYFLELRKGNNSKVEKLILE